LTFTGYLAPGIYAFIFNIARKNGLSVKEVQTILLREQIRLLGFTCDHISVAYPKKKGRQDGGKSFCKECWTRMVEIEPPRYDYQCKLVKEGEYTSLEAFLDRKRKDNANAKVAIEQESTT
jgi:hypothetical protein